MTDPQSARLRQAVIKANTPTPAPNTPSRFGSGTATVSDAPRLAPVAAKAELAVELNDPGEIVEPRPKTTEPSTVPEPPSV